MAAVNLLESNWISIQEIFELANRVLTQIFVGLWPKQKADVPATDLKKLATAFDTPEDPILLMKSRSVVAYLCFICASPGSTASTHSYKMKYQEYKGLYYNV
jgi:hypothetical protein